MNAQPHVTQEYFDLEFRVEKCMGNKKKSEQSSKISAKASKKAKAAEKVQRKEQKKKIQTTSKLKDAEESDDDLEGILSNVRDCTGPAPSVVLKN
jgi:hypothetical protein